MKPDTVKLIDGIFRKAVGLGWVDLVTANEAMKEVRGEKSKPRKKVKSPELGT